MVKFLKNNFLVVFGNLLYAIGVNIFITPLNLYSGGIYGYCQVIRTFLEKFIDFGTIDIAGTIYFVANIPLLILAFKKINKKFFLSTLFSVLCSNVFLTFLTISSPIIKDTLTACFIGGILSGAGSGLVLRAGSSGGGSDIIGMYLVKNNSKLSVGQIGLIINVVLYSVCAYIFSPQIAIYSIIFAAICSFATDKMHSQNIKVNALIFTDNYEIAKAINSRLPRGSTSWEGKGDYTGQKKYIISTVISKYEKQELKHIVEELDKHAFVVINSNISVLGNVENHLDA